MHKKILVASPSPAFGELIRLSLEESGKYRVRMVHTFDQAFQLAAENPFELAILDLDLPPQDLAVVADRLRASQRGQPLRRIIIPPDNNPNHASIAGLKAEAYLTKPFYIPDLLQSLEYLLEEPPPEWPPEPEPEPEPVADVPLPNPAAVEQPLGEMVADVDAKAAVVLRQRERWVSAGPMGEPALVEITQLINRAWNPTEPGDLVRYIRIVPTGECLLYARSLTGDLVLAMAFDASHPPTRIRSIIAPVVKTLNEIIETAPAGNGAQTAEESRDKIPLTLPDDFNPEDDGEAPDYNLAELLATLPSPDPEAPSSVPDAGDWVPESQLAKQEPSADFVLPWEVDWTGRQAVELPPQQTHPADPADNPHLANTQPTGRGRFDEALLSLADVLHYPTYTCLLLPAQPDQYLTRDTAAFLKEFIPRLFRAFGWDLQDLDVRPDHLQWSVRLPPAVSPGYLVRLLRKQTSKALYEEFKHLLPAPKTGDFWAPGYLIVNGAQAPSNAMIYHYIAQTRRRQGYFHS